MDAKTIARRINVRLAEQDRSRLDLVQAAPDIDRSQVYRIVSGSFSDVRLRTLTSIASGLGLTVSLLLDDEPDLGRWLQLVEEHDRQQVALAPAAPAVKPAAPPRKHRRAGVAQKAETPYFQPIYTVTAKTSKRVERRGGTR
jgi:DNA-binding Xre family transcriptional regulator